MADQAFNNCQASRLEESHPDKLLVSSVFSQSVNRKELRIVFFVVLFIQVSRRCKVISLHKAQAIRGKGSLNRVQGCIQASQALMSSRVSHAESRLGKPQSGRQ